MSVYVGIDVHRKRSQVAVVPRTERCSLKDGTASYWTGPGRGWLAELQLPAVSRQIVDDCLAFTDTLTPVIERLDADVRRRAREDPRARVLTTLPGVGPFTALVLVAEIGDITRFPSARKLASWEG